MAKELSEVVTKRQAIGDESMSAPVPAKIAPSGSLQSQRKSVDPKYIQPDSPVAMMSSAGVPEQSPTTGLDGARLPSVGVSPTLVSSPSSSRNWITQEMTLTGIMCILLLTPARFHI